MFDFLKKFFKSEKPDYFPYFNNTEIPNRFSDNFDPYYPYGYYRYKERSKVSQLWHATLKAGKRLINIVFSQESFELLTKFYHEWQFYRDLPILLAHLQFLQSQFKNYIQGSDSNQGDPMSTALVVAASSGCVLYSASVCSSVIFFLLYNKLVAVKSELLFLNGEVNVNNLMPDYRIQLEDIDSPSLIVNQEWVFAFRGLTGWVFPTNLFLENAMINDTNAMMINELCNFRGPTFLEDSLLIGSPDCNPPFLSLFNLTSILNEKFTITANRFSSWGTSIVINETKILVGAPTAGSGFEGGAAFFDQSVFNERSSINLNGNGDPNFTVFKGSEALSFTGADLAIAGDNYVISAPHSNTVFFVPESIASNGLTLSSSTSGVMTVTGETLGDLLGTKTLTAQNKLILTAPGCFNNQGCIYIVPIENLTSGNINTISGVAKIVGESTGDLLGNGNLNYFTIDGRSAFTILGPGDQTIYLFWLDRISPGQTIHLSSLGSQGVKITGASDLSFADVTEDEFVDLIYTQAGMIQYCRRRITFHDAFINLFPLNYHLAFIFT